MDIINFDKMKETDNKIIGNEELKHLEVNMRRHSVQNNTNYEKDLSPTLILKLIEEESKIKSP
jgi:hypothetical protein